MSYSDMTEKQLDEVFSGSRATLNRMVDEELERVGKKDMPINRVIVLKRILEIFRTADAEDVLTGDPELGQWLVKREITKEFNKEIENDFQ